MAIGDMYRVKAADMSARAEEETNPHISASFEALALSYLRLADQVDRNRSYLVETHSAAPLVQRQQPAPVVQQQQPRPTGDSQEQSTEI
jgi:hypothetical protein